MSKLIFFIFALIVGYAATANADCLSKMRKFNKASHTLKIKVHPTNGRTIKIQTGTASDDDLDSFNDVLRYCAETMHRDMFYISTDGKTLKSKCAITNVRTGAVNCSEVEPEEQPASFLSF